MRYRCINYCQYAENAVTSNDTGFPVETTPAVNAVVSPNFDAQKIADRDLPVNITPILNNLDQQIISKTILIKRLPDLH